jgi:hypothetical protein
MYVYVRTSWPGSHGDPIDWHTGPGDRGQAEGRQGVGVGLRRRVVRAPPRIDVLVRPLPPTPPPTLRFPAPGLRLLLPAKNRFLQARSQHTYVLVRVNFLLYIPSIPAHHATRFPHGTGQEGGPLAWWHACSEKDNSHAVFTTAERTTFSPPLFSAVRVAVKNNALFLTVLGGRRK